MLLRSVSALVLYLVPVSVLAATPTVLTVDGLGHCTMKGSPTSDAQIILTVDHPAGNLDGFKMKLSSGATIAPRIESTTPAPPSVGLKIDDVDAQCAPFGSLSFVFKPAAGTPTTVTCENVPLFLECKDRLAQEDSRAQLFWKWKGPAAIENLKSRGMDHAFTHSQRAPRETVYMVHLPSGMPAFPSPGALTEGTPVQVAVLASANSPRRYNLTISSCAAINSFRTTVTEAAPKEEDEKQGKGAESDAVEALRNALGATDATKAIKMTDDLIQKGVEGEQLVNEVRSTNAKATPELLNRLVVARRGVKLTSETIRLVPIGQWFQCGAGDMTYQLDTDSDRGGNPPTDKHTTVSVRIRPKYHVAAIALLGYDTAKKDGFTTAAETGADGTSRALIAREKDRVGSSLYVGGVWMVGGVDYENFRWWNWFANIFLAVNPRNPLHDACAGLALTPTGGVSLAVGMSVHPGRVLKAGFVEGASFTGQGDIPTRESWSDVNFGVVAGLAVDSRVYDSLVKTFANK